jgi:hypothetical protein
MDHETYIWEEFQAETTSFIGRKMLFDFGILGFRDFFGIFLGFKIQKIRLFPLGTEVHKKSYQCKDYIVVTMFSPLPSPSSHP